MEDTATVQGSESLLTISKSKGAVPPRSRGTQASIQPQAALFVRMARLSDTLIALGALIVAFLLTNVGRMPHGFGDFLAMRLTVKNLLLLMAFAVVWRVTCSLCGLYHWERVRHRREEALRILLASGLGGAVALVFAAISVTGAFRGTTVLMSVIGTSVAMLMARRFLHGLTDMDAGAQHNLLIVGTGPRARLLSRELALSQPDDRVVGYVDSSPQTLDGRWLEHYLGELTELESILLRNDVDEVYVALPMRSRYAEIETALQVCERTGVPAKWLADIFESAGGRRRYEVSQKFSVISITGEAEHDRLLLKRLIDVIGASVGLLLLSPVLVCAALAIKVTSRGPILYVQDRHGLYRRRFRMYKFRTMVENAEKLQGSLEHLNEASGAVFKIKDDPRMTSVGHFLRRTSIDEVPQLVNVLKGEMSLVGPRPLPLRDVGRFNEATLVRRFSVRPGLTGLWQVSGRSDLSFERWMELDLQYIDQWSLGLDFKIIAKTLPAVLKASGAA